jgi:regulator of sigma E protease
VTVLRFSLGFGPALFAFHRGGTEYRLSWIPLGGYVQMAGDSPGEDGAMPGGREQFLSHPWPGRLLIAIAGPMANLITAFLVMSCIGMVGITYLDFENVLGPTPDSSRAAMAGLREGDHIVALDDTQTPSWERIFRANDAIDSSHAVTLHVERDGAPLAIPLPAEARRPVLRSLNPVPLPPVVGGVTTGMPAYKAGLREGDRILAVNGEAIRTWDDLPSRIGSQVDRPVKLDVQRGTRTIEVMVKPVDSEGRGQGSGRIGIEAPRRRVFVERVGPLESVQLGFQATGALVASVYQGMWLTVSRPLYYREYLGGPLFIAQAASESARRGIDSYLQFLAMINIAIMAFNLLPIPVLDGGHILLALLEAVRRQAITARAYMRFQKIGLAVIGTLFIVILANDPLRVLQRWRALDRTGDTPAREETVAPSPP